MCEEKEKFTIFIVILLIMATINFSIDANLTNVMGGMLVLTALNLNKG